MVLSRHVLRNNNFEHISYRKKNFLIFEWIVFGNLQQMRILKIENQLNGTPAMINAGIKFR